MDIGQACTGKSVIAEFLHECKCEELVPESGRVIVFNTDISLKLAFFALAEHDVKSAPLWDSTTQAFSGLLTVSDLIEILRYCHQKNSLSYWSEYTIAKWRDLVQEKHKLENPETPELKTMVYISPDSSLLDALHMLKHFGIHRLPILEESMGTVLTICTHLRILNFLVAKFCDHRQLFDDKISDLGIGSFEKLHTAYEDVPLIEVLDMMIAHRISAVPIIERETERVVNIYCRSDVTYITHDKTLDILNNPVSEVLQSEAKELGLPKFFTCQKHDSLQRVFEIFSGAQLHRLVVTDETGKCVGIVSLNDLFNYFLE
eukprot:TRINITY_DN66934_c0_g1_i1.p1 TRINITY_DN66934_c0_g1~~TRINITY_DN66934_c0_g1_i1.p1  ORF type:complete len:317 (+),score=69.23 TRINITY_DN66934_c0_g1_i1:150-1100(+)